MKVNTVIYLDFIGARKAGADLLLRRNDAIGDAHNPIIVRI